ncbi:mechanosensitive ion channel family protein [Compostibacter hankyongensis]|uniref:Mechanosensitive ion channel family protein n=1 Tax=Compostibacter hankyongensis TaxID=1007089 RepID=A0ABP8FE45_9BACT
MLQFWERSFLDNPVGDYLVLVGMLALVFLLRGPIARLIIGLLYRIVKRSIPDVQKKELMALLRRPLELFLLIFVFIGNIDHFQYPRVLDFSIHFLNTRFSSVLNVLKLIVLTVSFFWILLRLIDFVALILSRRLSSRKNQSDAQIVLFFRDLLKAFIGLIGLAVILRFMVGESVVNKLVGAMGIGAAALALAGKESIENLIGSFVILLDKPFRTGDYVTVSGVSGSVEKIGLRSTRIRTDNKTYVTVPNKQMVDNILDNGTLISQRRVLMKLELPAYTHAGAIEQVLKDIEAVLKAEPEILEGYTLNLNDITRDAYVIQLIYYTNTTAWNSYNALRERVNLAIAGILEQRHIRG